MAERRRKKHPFTVPNRVYYYETLVPSMLLDTEVMNAIESINAAWDAQYAPHAARNSLFLRRRGQKPEDRIRPPYFRDSDRILHSRAYTRYIDKTQVFSLVDNDHITHRVLHVQLVSKVARTIGRFLGYNEDLIEAIALGHDIGHPPYGHLGERFLDGICEDHGIGRFLHNVQAIQFLDTIEDLDLTLQVLDGILCHNGEVHNQELHPQGDRSWESFDAKLAGIRQGRDIFPLTYEGCIVRFADNIAYLGRDLEDAIEIQLITEENELKNYPKLCKELFNVSDGRKINSLLLDTLIKDILNSSYRKDAIAFSDPISDCVEELKAFNDKYIYSNQQLHTEDDKIQFMFTVLFETFLRDLEEENTSSRIYKHMLDGDGISDAYTQNATPAEAVRDYIAGMTNRYFDTVFRDLITPERRMDFE